MKAKSGRACRVAGSQRKGDSKMKQLTRATVATIVMAAMLVVSKGVFAAPSPQGPSPLQGAPAAVQAEIAKLGIAGEVVRETDFGRPGDWVFYNPQTKQYIVFTAGWVQAHEQQQFSLTSGAANATPDAGIWPNCRPRDYICYLLWAIDTAGRILTVHHIGSELYQVVQYYQVVDGTDYLPPDYTMCYAIIKNGHIIYC